MKNLFFLIATLCIVVSADAQTVMSTYLVSNAAKPAPVKPYFRAIDISLPTGCNTAVVQAGPIVYCQTVCECQCWHVTYYFSSSFPWVNVTSATQTTGCTNSCSATTASGPCNSTFQEESVEEKARKWILDNGDGSQDYKNMKAAYKAVSKK